MTNNKNINKIKNLKISEGTHSILKKYCKSNGLKMFAFVELLIKEKCKQKKIFTEIQYNYLTIISSNVNEAS